VPYSCPFSICSFYAEMGLLVLIYVCSLCLVAIDLFDYFTYKFLQVPHLSLYILQEFVLVLTILSLSCLYIVFVAQMAMIQISVMRLVIFCMK